MGPQFAPSSGTAIVVYLMIGLGLVVILAPLWLAWRAGSVKDFFEIPYITWYLLHYTIATLGVIAVLILALVGVINATAVAALLGGLFGYVLGSSSHRQPAGAVSGGQTPTSPDETRRPGE